jgi:hypothetical protein
MDVIFPPRAEHQSEIDDRLSLLSCLLTERAATYAATPITTGWRFVDWLSDGNRSELDGEEYRRQHEESVVKGNCDDAALIVGNLRREMGGVVIDPTQYKNPAWSQSDYHCFWGQVIERYVNRVVLADGWQWSNGCCFEFLTATRSGAATLRQDLSVLAVTDGIGLIRHSISVRAEKGVDVEFASRIYGELISASRSND